MNKSDIHYAANAADSVQPARKRQGTVLNVKLDGWSLVAAFVMTFLFFACANTFLGWRIDAAFRKAQVKAVATASEDQAAGRAVQLAGADADMAASPLAMNAFRGSKTGREQILTLVAGLTGADASSTSDLSTARLPEGLEELLELHLTGQRSGWTGFPAATQPLNGREFMSSLELHDPVWSAAVAGAQGEQDTTARAFVAGYIDVVAREIRPFVRSYVRLNGWIQWITVYCFFLAVTLLLRRLLWLIRCRRVDQASGLLQKLEHLKDRISGRLNESKVVNLVRQNAAKWYPSNNASSDGESGAQSKASPSDLDRFIYGPISQVITILPSLGFVGTVIGMGEALLLADGLFSASDKTAAIGEITRQLGLAFDTTLVGLVTGMGATVLMVYVRLREERLWKGVDLAERTEVELKRNPQPQISDTKVLDAMKPVVTT